MLSPFKHQHSSSISDGSCEADLVAALLKLSGVSPARGTGGCLLYGRQADVVC